MAKISSVKKIIVEDYEATTASVVAWDINEKPTSVVIGSLTKLDGTAPADVFCLSWRYENKTLRLTFLGLDTGTHHIATIIAQV
jgi:hypothetical protein